MDRSSTDLIRPGRAVMTATRVERKSASCRLWVTKITVLRVRRQMSRSHSPMSTRVCSSRAPKGSSIKRIFVSIAPAVRVNEAPEHSEERGLAAAGRADQRAELALAYRERDVVERLDRPRAGHIPLGDVLDRDEPGGCLHTSWRIARAITSLWIS